jgi:putative ABC transport system permease protein
MLKNYLKIFTRNLYKHPGYTLSNLTSLAVGMTTCILILLYVRYELNWNTFNQDYNRIYRVQQKVLFKNDVQIYRKTGYLLAPELKKQVPEIENTAITKSNRDEYLSSSDELTFNEKDGCYADGNIFKVLTFKFLKGDPETALSEPFSVVLTEKLVRKYFPGQDAYGKILKSSKNKSLKVTGIIKELPFNSDFRPDYIVSMPTYNAVAEWKGYKSLENIAAAMFSTYLTLKPNVSLEAVNRKIYDFQDQYITDNFKKLYLKPLSEIHLTPSEKDDIEIALNYIGAFAIFVLILACINFINLTTANSFLRKNEIGIRKTTGASRKSLFFQFIGESLLFTFFFNDAGILLC